MQACPTMYDVILCAGSMWRDMARCDVRRVATLRHSALRIRGTRQAYLHFAKSYVIIWLNHVNDSKHVPRRVCGHFSKPWGKNSFSGYLFATYYTTFRTRTASNKLWISLGSRVCISILSVFTFGKLYLATCDTTFRTRTASCSGKCRTRRHRRSRSPATTGRIAQTLLLSLRGHEISPAWGEICLYIYLIISIHYCLLLLLLLLPLLLLLLLLLLLRLGGSRKQTTDKTNKLINVCVYIYICMCIHVYIYIYIHMCMYVCVCMCIYIYIYICIYIYVFM